jgi:hypothetical protein
MALVSLPAIPSTMKSTCRFQYVSASRLQQICTAQGDAVRLASDAMAHIHACMYGGSSVFNLPLQLLHALKCHLRAIGHGEV